MKWKPILHGAMRERTLEAVWAIADGLCTAEHDGPSLASGSGGLAVMYAYLGRARAGAGYRELALAELTRSLKGASEPTLGQGLYDGTTGIAWAAALVNIRLPAVGPVTEAVDQALLAAVSRSRWQGEYGLIRGLVGFGAYALERLPQPAASRLLVHVVDRLAELALWSPEGCTWLTRPDVLPQRLRPRAPDGCYDLGLSRGLPGVIALLGGAVAAGVEKARPLLDGAVSWLLNQRLEGRGHSVFPAWAGPGETRVPARSGWCHGDPGVAAGLLLAARAVQEPLWEREALAIARRAAQRPPADTGVGDAGFCHGAIGLAHLFNRMYQATGDQELQLAARFWIEQTLAMRRPDHLVCGYQETGGVLRGAAGVALGLLAAAVPIEPAWDRMFLLSLPPAGQANKL